MGQTASNATLPFINDTDANFRSWVQFIGDNLELGGFIKTADTGQINNVTVTRPLATSTYQGYEIRRMADSLQATFPVFMKIEYGSLSNVATNPAIRITFGTGSNGTGTITGSIFAAAVFAPGNNSSAASVSAKVSAANNRFTLGMNYASALNSSGQFMLGVERTKDATFADNNTGLYIFSTGGNLGWASSNANFAIIPFTGSAPTKEADGGAIHPSADSSLDGADVGIYPLKPSCFGKKVYSPTNLMVYRTNEIASDSTIAVDVNGTTISYRTCGVRHLASARSANNPGVMFRYD